MVAEAEMQIGGRIKRLRRQKKLSQADLAQALGYVDQSHLGREFRRYSGTTPAAFARARPRGDFGGFVQA